MLKLKRVELQGFKSFYDRTELRFNGGGIAAIVGPNGCGKSNLSDAISWVLGEQSAKSLRGARMEDVIFAGTRDRKPVGMAAVTMTLTQPNGNGNGNGNGHKPGEVTITRRLFRSGESEYLIDGRTARLRDIQDLFMGTGLGPESYAIIEQGRIGQILSSRPQDRRGIIEEAAGITKYRARRRLAESRLESAKQNLSRVFDILEEVTRQANSLKRQASKAKRYGELKTEMDAKLRLALAGRFRILEREAAKAALDLNFASAELKRLSAQVGADDQERERLQASCYEGDARQTEARRNLAELQVELERTRGKLEAQVRESAAIEQRMARGEGESHELEIRAGHLDSERAAQAGALAELERQLAEGRTLIAGKNRTRQEMQARIQQHESALESGRLEVLRILGETSVLRNQLAQMDEYLAGMERESARSRKEEQAAAADLERLALARKSLSETVARQQMELASVAGERGRTEQELAEQNRSAAEVRKQVDDLRAECSHLEARRSSLENILSHRTYTADSVKRLFGALEKGQAQDFRPAGLVADFVEVDAAWERAAEEFLHDELEYVVVESWEQAARGVNLLRADLDGRATFLVHGSAADSAAVESVPAGFERLTDHLRLTNGLASGAGDLLPRMAQCYLAPDRESAEALAPGHPNLYFLLADGLCYHGRTLTGGKKTASGPLAMKRELRETSRKLEARLRDLEARTGEAARLTHEIAGLDRELERLKGVQQSREKDALALDHEMRKLSEETARANSRVSVARLELDRLRRENERSLEQRDANLRVVGEKEALREQRERALEARRDELEEIEAESVRLGEEHAALRAELAGLEERQRAEKTALARVEAQFHEMDSRRRQIAEEIEHLGAERARLLADNIELDRNAGVLAARIVEVETMVDRLAAEEAAMRQTLAAAEEALKLLRLQVEAAHQKRSEIEIDLVRKQSDLKYLDETSRKELNCPVEQLAESDGGGLAPDPAELAEAERCCQDLRSRIEALGPINSQALEEYQETQQRQDFLTAQRQDLLDSIRDTEKAIQDIDEVSRTRFSEAFEAINTNFRQIFLTLFGGGSGEMRLTDEANANDSGIEIVASPPGKKLQNVLLLSGGEKALAALALLMAIFRYQPSPFCVLDEVDAPLDEVNIQRLTRMLRDMSGETQFIVITHSKKTMESAQSMYGVTMQEPGISKLVSVRMQPALEAVAV